LRFAAFAAFWPIVSPKARQNKGRFKKPGAEQSGGKCVKHGLSFETAALVFDDPLHSSKPDPHPDGDRWHTIGLVGSVLLLVIYT
jgi:hypothetical protein